MARVRPLLASRAKWAWAAALLSLLTPNWALAQRDAQNTVAIVGATVIAMDRSRPHVLPDHTIIARGGTIAWLGPRARARLPKGSRIVDGRGKFLIPGLADLHVHIDDPRDFAMLLANGVTTTLNMGGASDRFIDQTRGAIRTGSLLGPEPLIARVIDGPGDEGGTAFVPKTVEEARAAVRAAKARGYDFVKVYSRLGPEIFRAVIDESRRARMPVIGHVVRSVGLAPSLAAGQRMIAHGEEYLTVFGDAPPDPARIPELAALSRRYGVFVTANLDGIQRIAAQWGKRAQVDAYLADPAHAALRPFLRERWQRAAYARLGGRYDAEARFVTLLIPALQRAGVTLLAGTDTPDIPGVAPGVSLVNELLALQAAGLTSREALATATANAGAFARASLPRAQCFGVLRVGCRADAVLLAANPLDDLARLRRPQGLLLRGRWLDRPTLDGLTTAP